MRRQRRHYNQAFIVWAGEAYASSVIGEAKEIKHHISERTKNKISIEPVISS